MRWFLDYVTIVACWLYLFVVKSVLCAVLPKFFFVFCGLPMFFLFVSFVLLQMADGWTDAVGIIVAVDGW